MATHIVEEYFKTLVVLEWKEIVENWNKWKDVVIVRSFEVLVEMLCFS